MPASHQKDLKDKSQLFVDQAPSAIAMFDKEMRYLAASQQWLIDWKLEGVDVIGVCHYDLFKNISDEWEKIHQASLNGATNKKQEDSFVTKKGLTQWISWEIRPWYTEDEKIGGVLIFTTDITSIKHKEYLLRRYQGLLEKTNEVASIGTWEVDLRSEEVFWNQVTRDIHEVDDDFEPTFELGINFYEKGPNRDKIDKAFRNCIEHREIYDVEVELITAKGTPKWVRAVGLPEVENGEVTLVYGLFQDIDEKTRANIRLSLQEEQFRQTFEFAANGMALVGLKGEWLQINKRLTQILGYKKKELSQMTFADITHPDDIEKDLESLAKLTKGEVESYQMEKRYFHKNGTTVWCMLSVSIVRNNAGEPSHYVSQINDISKVKEVEEEIKTLLDVTQEQNERLLNFAHIVSHNLRSHSGNLSMLIDLMKIEVPSATDNPFFPLLTEASENLKETITHLNEVVAMSSKTYENLEQLNVAEYLENTLINLKASLIESGTKIAKSVDDSLTISAIPAYLESILLNLVSNAIKYRRRGTQNVIEISAEEQNGFVLITIKDNGLGIDMERNGLKLFGMYKTFHGNEDAKGIGLFITKNQVDAMGGRIEVESELNRGATFKVYLKK